MCLLWTLYSALQTDTMCALMWNELVAHRSANNVVSSKGYDFKKLACDYVLIGIRDIYYFNLPTTDD